MNLSQSTSESEKQEQLALLEAACKEPAILPLHRHPVSCAVYNLKYVYAKIKSELTDTCVPFVKHLHVFLSVCTH